MTWCIETPQYIMDEEEVDIFESNIPAGSYHTKICNALWQMYRYRGLGSCRNQFIQRMVDRYNLLKEKWEAIFIWYEANKSSLTGLDTATMETESQNETLPDTPLSSTDEYLSDRSGSTITYKTGMAAELAKKMMQDKTDVYYEYVKEYESLFSEFAL